jgi:signal transduction histidine kinase/DNA-binding response OmpR family regulator/HAMP domain-containing protein
MRRLSLARSLRLALLGLAVVLSVLAGLGVAGLYTARQRYEDRLANAYALDAAAGRLLAAGVVEEATRRLAFGRAGASQRRRARRAFEDTAAQARRLAAGDPPSLRLIDAAVTAQATVRHRRATRGQALAARVPVAELSARQATRRARARATARDDSRRALVAVVAAGALALAAALAFVAALLARVRRPLDELVRASQRLAAGRLEARVRPGGPDELRALGGAFNAMADDLAGALHRVEAERERLRTTIESLGDALLVADADGVVVAANPRATELVPELSVGARIGEARPGLPPVELVLEREIVVERDGRTLAVTAVHVHGAEAEADRKPADADHRPADPDRKPADADHRPADPSQGPAGGAPAQGTSVVWTVRDVTERARLERLKSEFVATASHELRSPLTSIKGFVELLEQSKGLTKRQREFVEIIRISTNRLVDLATDLLDVARVEAGQIEIHRRPVDLAEAVREVATLMRPRLEERRQSLTVDIDDAHPPALADPGRVRQILINLLTNAHLYTPEGGHLEIDLRESPHALELIVSDNGPGMTPEQVAHIFERFYRVAEGDHASGTGLGLSIVKSLVDLHAGSIEVHSEPGRGTAMHVRLPRALEITDAAPRFALAGKRVLVLDDEPEIAELIAARIEPFGVQSVISTDGPTAIEHLRSESFDAMTLDILMPGMSGFQVLRALRSDPRLARIPVVVVSVFSGREALSGEWVVSKPIDAEELADALGAAVLAGRVRLLVVSRPELRERLSKLLGKLGIECEWASTAPEVARLCAQRHFEVALVDAGLPRPRAALDALDLRGRRLRRSVVVFSSGEPPEGFALLDAEPIPIEDAGATVLGLLETRSTEADEAGASETDQASGTEPGTETHEAGATEPVETGTETHEAGATEPVEPGPGPG